MTTVSSTYDWAIEYITYLVNKGILDAEDVKGLDQKRLIDLANKCESEALSYYENQKDEAV